MAIPITGSRLRKAPPPEPFTYVVAPEVSIPGRIDNFPQDYSTRIANRGNPNVPDAPRRLKEDLTGRILDPASVTWMLPLAPMPAFTCEPKARPYPAMPATRGRFSWSICDAVTGARFGSFHANHTAEAITIAGAWAISCGFEFGDVNVQHDL